MAHATVAQLEEWTNLNALQDAGARAARQALLTRQLESASNMSDSYCNRQFGTVTAERMFYPPVVRSELEIGDVQSVTAVTEDSSAVASDGWRLDPSPIPGRPSRYLRRLGTAGWIEPVAVTAVWGWAAVPDAVVQAVLMLAARLYRRKETPTGTATYGEEGAYYIRSNDPDVGALLDVYRLPAVA